MQIQTCLQFVALLFCLITNATVIFRSNFLDTLLQSNYYNTMIINNAEGAGCGGCPGCGGCTGCEECDEPPPTDDCFDDTNCELKRKPKEVKRKSKMRKKNPYAETIKT